MAKRRRTVTRSHSSSESARKAGFSRGPSGPGGKSMLPPSERKGNQRMWLIGAVVAVAVVVVLAGVFLLQPGTPAATLRPTFDSALIHPPFATPLASPPAVPAGDGTSAEIDTALGPIVFEIYNQSAPVASENFTNLADAGFYDGLTFHRIVPDFVIQGGDPDGDGSGGPGYTIQDEPVVGDYTRGVVAMARTSQPNSQGSQFFIVLSDDVANTLPKSGDYVIFGKVTSGMDVVDKISAMPNSGSPNNRALDPVVMTRVSILPPGSI